MKPAHVVWCIVASLVVVRPAGAAEAQIAVAANFAHPMQRIADAFEHDTGHHAVVTTGATGTLVAQIENGAPFDALLSADRTGPERLVADGFALADSRFAYAFGVLVLWSARVDYVDSAGAVLGKGAYRHLAIASPKLAPYGAAAIEALGSLGLLERVRPKLVQGQSIAQAFQFVESGNAELGFVALSQVAAPEVRATGSYWVVPDNLHGPIEQDAIVLRRGAANPATWALCEYLKGPGARSIIGSYGYKLPASP